MTSALAVHGVDPSQYVVHTWGAIRALHQAAALALADGDHEAEGVLRGWARRLVDLLPDSVHHPDGTRGVVCFEALRLAPESGRPDSVAA